MEKDLTLLIMAAGMGSRFGGLKQIEPVGVNGEFIIDYSIYDAIKAGFNKIVFIIKEENYEVFKETIGSRCERQNVEVDYVFQKQDTIPDWVDYPKDRTKPWGTSHAILSAKDKIKGNFLVINADDFYGRDAYLKASNYLKDKKEHEYGIIAYLAKNVLSENGLVKRGVCEVENNYLTKITESSIGYVDDSLDAYPLNGSPMFTINPDTPISMNLFCFSPDIFDYLEKNLDKFFQDNKDDLESCEYLIPDSVYGCIKEGYASVKVVPTDAKWYGITYKEDKDEIVQTIRDMIEDGTYPNNLWEK